MIYLLSRTIIVRYGIVYQEEVDAMAVVVEKPTVFVFGEKKKDAPAEPTITKEQLESMIQDVQKYFSKQK